MAAISQWWPNTRTFVREVSAEAKKVTWPDRKTVVGTTVVVIVACFIFGFYLFLVDSGLSWLIDRIFRAAGVIA